MLRALRGLKRVTHAAVKCKLFVAESKKYQHYCVGAPDRNEIMMRTRRHNLNKNFGSSQVDTAPLVKKKTLKKEEKTLSIKKEDGVNVGRKRSKSLNSEKDDHLPSSRKRLKKASKEEETNATAKGKRLKSAEASKSKIKNEDFVALPQSKKAENSKTENKQDRHSPKPKRVKKEDTSKYEQSGDETIPAKKRKKKNEDPKFELVLDGAVQNGRHLKETDISKTQKKGKDSPSVMKKGKKAGGSKSKQSGSLISPRGKQNSNNAKKKTKKEKISQETVPSKNLRTQSPLSEEELLKRYTERREKLKRYSTYPPTELFRKLYYIFESQRDPQKARSMSKYLKFKFEFFGIQTPERREIFKSLKEEMKNLSPTDLLTFLCETWYSPEREFQHVAVDLLEREYMRAYSNFEVTPEEQAFCISNLVGQFLAGPSSWWDTVDPLATKVVGPLVKKFPEQLLSVMDDYNASCVTWLVRTSLIYQLHYGKDTDVPRLFRYCLAVADQKEFFIQKAIGWALREHYRRDPGAVRQFVAENRERLSSLAVREALKHDK